MAVEGTLERFRLPEILQVISQQRKTGILTVQGADDIIAVSFLEGRIVAADSLTETTESGLGAILVEQGRVTEEELRASVARSDAQGERLADRLVEEGRVDREGLLEALRLQTLRLLLALLDWRVGEFKFYGGDEVSYEEGFRSIGVDELLLQAIEDGSGEGARDVPMAESRMRRIEGARPVRVHKPASLDRLPPPPSEEGSAIWLTPEEDRVLEAVAPGRTVAEVADQVEVPTERARYVLFRLSREGLVQDIAPARRPPPGAAGPAPDREDLAESAPKGALTAEAEAEEEAEAVRRPRASVAGPVAAALGLLAAALLALTLAAGPVAFVLPFPWLEGTRASLHATRDSARLLELDLAAKTFFLLRGRFPDGLDELLELGLLEERDLVDARGRRLALEPREGSYVLRPLVPVAPDGDAQEAFREGIAGNFLLDPEFLPRAGARREAEAPLVLLD